MSDQETRGQNAAPESPENEPGATPDFGRRKLAKAALSAPVIMTLAPGRVLGAGGVCTEGQISLINSIDGAGGVLEGQPGFVSYARGGDTESLTECNACWNGDDDTTDQYPTNYDQCVASQQQGELGSVPAHERLRDFCEGTSGFESIDAACPVDVGAATGGGDSLTTSTTELTTASSPTGATEPGTNISRRDFYNTLRGKKK